MIARLREIYHLLWSFLSALFYGFPSRKIFVIGVTGTKGKSTSVALINAVLERGGYKTAYFSSVEVKIGDTKERNATGNTMPGRHFIQKFLSRAVKAGCQYAILEVTSQGVVQSRHKNIHFDVAGMTCLHPEHIEAHGSFEAYREAKLAFFRAVARQKHGGMFLINNTGTYRHAFESATKLEGVPQKKITFYRTEDVTPLITNRSGRCKNEILESQFNQENAALAAEVGRIAGVPDGLISKALCEFSGLSGRMEFLRKKGFPDVIIDYAHTPGSFEAVYQYLTKERSPKKLVCVFGSYGEGRDRWKRPCLGEVSEGYCDDIILTNEGPGDESPRGILEEIASGINDKTKYRIIEDREEAIREAIRNAKEGDIVALLGKGHEDYIRIGDKKIPWDERGLVERIFDGS